MEKRAPQGTPRIIDIKNAERKKSESLKLVVAIHRNLDELTVSKGRSLFQTP